MPLDPTTGAFTCPACGSTGGLLAPDGAPPAPDEYICVDCPGAGEPATDDSHTGDDGHRHTLIDQDDVVAFYGTPQAADAAPAAQEPASAPDGGGDGDSGASEGAGDPQPDGGGTDGDGQGDGPAAPAPQGAPADPGADPQPDGGGTDGGASGDTPAASAPEGAPVDAGEGTA